MIVEAIHQIASCTSPGFTIESPIRDVCGILDPAYPPAASAYPEADPTLFLNQLEDVLIMIN